MEYKTDAVLDIQGNAIFNASVRVLTESRQLATVYNASGVPIPNPVGTDKTGEYSLALPNGKYFLEIGVNGTVYETKGPVSFFDAQDDYVSVLRFLSPEQVMNAYLKLATIDSTAQFQSAINFCVSNQRALYVNDGYSLLVSSLNISGLKRLYGGGLSSKIKHKAEIAKDTHMLVATGGSGYRIQNLYLDGSAVDGPNESMLLRFNACSDVTVSDVTFYESSSSSLKFQGSSGNPCQNVVVTRCQSIRSGRANGFNRNGLDFFLCHKLSVSDCYVKGLGADPNNVGIILMGCHYFSVDKCVLEDNASEQVQVIGTDYLTEQVPYSINRAMFGSITNNILRHTLGLSKTSNLTIGENANDVTVSGNDISGSLGSAIVLFKWTKNVIIYGNKIHDSRGSAVTINDKVYGNVTIQSNIMRDLDGASAVVVDSNTAPAPGIQIKDNHIINIDADGNATVSRPFEFKGAMLGGITVDGNICQGTYTHAVDMTGGGMVGQIIISNNDFRGYTVAGWRAPLRESYCWGNIEPNIEAPAFYRASQAFSAATSGTVFKAWNAAQSKGNLSYKLALDTSSAGMAYVAEGVVTGSTTGEKKIRITEVGAGAISGTIYSFARPG